MSLQTWREFLTVATTNGTAKTASAAATIIPAENRIVLPAGYFYVGRMLRFEMSGRISCVVTTPGTVRLDIRMGASGTTVVYDTGALNLNIVAKTDVPWFFEVTLVCRAIGTGTSTTFFPHGARFQSEAVVGSPLPSAGGNGILYAPVGAPAVGAGTDVTAAHAIDVFHTQTVATGSFQVHTYTVESLN